MSMPRRPEIPRRMPMRELLLAQALDACITAERDRPGSAPEVIARHPVWARAELHTMMSLVGSLDAAAREAHISPEFRSTARSRLMQRIGGESALGAVAMRGPRLTALPSRTGHRSGAWRRSKWLWRGSAGLFAAVLGVAATLTASANALPGEPLYNVKQTQEAISVRLAADDQARALALFGQADARLDETARLLQQGRTDAAVETTQRYGQAVQRATATYIVTMDESRQPAAGALHVQTRLTQDQDQLQAILQTAPEPARADLREALVTTRRGRALVADPRRVEQAQGKSDAGRAAVTPGVPAAAAEDLPTETPQGRPTVEPRPPTPFAPSVVAARATEQPEESAVVAHPEVPGRGDEGGRRGQSTSSNGQNTSSNNGRPEQPTAKQPVTEDQHGDDVAISPAVAASEEGDTSDRTDGRAGSLNGRDVPPVEQSAERAETPRTSAPRVAVPADKPNSGGNGRGNSDSRPVATAQPPEPAQPARAVAQATPTPTPARRGNGEDAPRPSPRSSTR
ncbi:MAG: DUF5667 domain-containing protein [Chloroflexi bacterium]|nr:DUF5667 domain-containing protein [Chloroflexota bacterium]